MKHPGIVLRETVFKDRRIEDIAREMRISRKTIWMLLNGHCDISLSIACRLAEMTDTLITKWMLMQIEYEVALLRGEDDEHIQRIGF